jgi:enterobactin synthetase component D / holo-[acyl-carrier protein] synthase
MLQDLVPAHVATSCHTGDGSPVSRFSAEAALIGGALPSRRLEFITARCCARQALAALGVGPEPILRGSHGEPAWPDGVVGSITHCRGFRAAAVALTANARAIGIDAEPHAPLPEDVRSLVPRPEEERRAASTPGGVCWDLLVFVAKECVYKAWFPLAGAWLDHADAAVSWNAGEGTFCAELVGQIGLARSLGLEAVNGRFAVRNNLLLAAVTVPPL